MNVDKINQYAIARRVLKSKKRCEEEGIDRDKILRLLNDMRLLILYSEN